MTWEDLRSTVCRVTGLLWLVVGNLTFFTLLWVAGKLLFSEGDLSVVSIQETIILVAGVAFMIYTLPSFVSAVRDHKQSVAIAALNLLLGWTFIGWSLALVWALITLKDNE